jgi:membrane-associated phospholipid phosphatase
VVHAYIATQAKIFMSVREVIVLEDDSVYSLLSFSFPSTHSMLSIFSTLNVATWKFIL